MATKTPVLDFFNKLMEIYVSDCEMYFKDSVVVSLSYNYNGYQSSPESITITTQLKKYDIPSDQINGIAWEIVVKEVVVKTVGDILND